MKIILSLLRNLLAVVGVLALVVASAGYLRFQGLMARLDPGAKTVFMEAGARYLETLDPGVTMVKSVQVKEGLSPSDVADSLKSLAVQQGMFFVGESPFYKQVEAVTGKPFRFVAFYSFCDAMVGVKMLEYNAAYTAFMPCRIALAEDKTGRLWLHMLDLDMFIHGGKPLPPEVRAGAIRVRDSLEKMMAGAAKGEF